MTLGPRTRLGIVFAMGEERAGLERILAQSYKHARTRDRVSVWGLGNVDLMLAVSGIGRKAAAITTRRLIDEGAQMIISAGIAAGLSPDAELGNVVTARRVILWDGDNRAETPVDLRMSSALPPSGTIGIRISECDLATSDAVIFSSRQKQNVFQLTGAAALDMESYAVGEVCSACSVPFGAIRAISDTASQDLPPQIELLLTRNNAGRLAVILAHPNIIPSLIRLRSQSSLAISNLSEVLAIFLLRLM